MFETVLSKTVFGPSPTKNDTVLVTPNKTGSTTPWETETQTTVFDHGLEPSFEPLIKLVVPFRKTEGYLKGPPRIPFKTQHTMDIS